MITVQDRITVQAARLETLERLFREDYLPGAAQRGLQLVATRVSPPVLTANAPLTYTLLWQVADVGAWWAMRAQSGVPEIAAFWAAVDALCLSRERTYSKEDGAASLPGPADTAAGLVSIRGHRQTAQLALKPEVADDPAALEAVFEPAHARYLYFVSKNDDTHHFSKTRQEHEAMVDKYQRGL